MSTATFREVIDHSDMENFQIRTVIICLIGSVITGLSILLLPFTAPAIAENWNLDPATLGTLLSSTLIGMTIGSFILGPIADVYGRRSVLIFCMLLMTIGFFYSAYAPDTASLMIARVITGLGIGGSLPCYNTLVAEYSSLKRRDLCIGLIVTSGALSGIIGGTASAYLIDAYDWRTAFKAAGILALVTIPIIVIWLPESVDYLLTKRKSDTLNKINVLLKKMQHKTIDELPEVSKEKNDKQGFKVLLSKSLFLRTILMWISCLMVFTSFYFCTSWIPKLLVNEGWELSKAIYAMVLMNVGGLGSGVIFGVIATRFSYRVSIAFVLTGAIIMFILFGYLGSNQALIYVMPLLLGVFVFSTLTSQYALLPRLYEPSIRNTGTGWALAVGKLGAISGPYFAGVLLSRGWESFSLFYLFSLTYACALVIVLLIWRLERRDLLG